jgi:hypothetical protein
MRFRLALSVSALVATFGSTSVAMALPGDRAIDDPAPKFRLDARHLEPGCYDVGRLGYWFANIDASSFDVDEDFLPDGELVLKNLTGIGGVPSFDVDQVLVPSKFGGYAVHNDFDVGSGANENAPSISNGETGTERFAPDANGNGNPDPIDAKDIVVCLSDDDSTSQNEPYAQETGGMVSAKNRPVIVPKVTGVGASALEPLNTYKLSFGYDTPVWYEAPAFDGHGLFDAVTDPESFIRGGSRIPDFVAIKPRPDDFEYDARRVNDVDFPIEDFHGGDVYSGQTIVFKRGGDDTAWLEDDNGNKLAALVTSVTQGDFPVTWSLRPSLANPAAFQEVEFTLADLHAWEQDWQDYYDCEGPIPAMPLAPGSNPPASDDADDCNEPPAPAPSVQPPAAPTVNNNSTSTTTTTNTTVVNRCVSSRQVSLRLAKKARKGTVRVAGKTIRARRSNGRLRAAVDLRGMEGAPGAYVRATVRQKVGGKWQRSTRLLRLC